MPNRFLRGFPLKRRFVVGSFAFLLSVLVCSLQDRIYGTPQTICGNFICESPTETVTSCRQDCTGSSICDQLDQMIVSACPAIERGTLRQIQSECKTVISALNTTSPRCRDASDIIKTIELQLVAECPILPACSSYLLSLSELADQAKTKADHHCCPAGQDKCGPRRGRDDDDDDDRNIRSCISLQNDNNNCGACGHVCDQNTTCTDGLCKARK